MERQERECRRRPACLFASGKDERARCTRSMESRYGEKGGVICKGPRNDAALALIPLRAGSVAIGFVNRIRAGDVFLVHRLGRTISHASGLLGDRLFLTQESITLLDGDGCIRTVMFDDDGGITPLFDHSLRMGTKHANRTSAYRKRKDIGLLGRLLLISLACQ